MTVSYATATLACCLALCRRKESGAVDMHWFVFIYSLLVSRNALRYPCLGFYTERYKENLCGYQEWQATRLHLLLEMPGFEG